MIRFWMPMVPPTITAQEHRVGKTKNGRVVIYDSPELKAGRQKLMDHLARHAPDAPYPAHVPVELHVAWCFPTADPDRVGTFRTSRPDTDNLVKLLKDCMTKVGFWHDDAQVCREFLEKFWSDRPGIFVEVRELEKKA